MNITIKEIAKQLGIEEDIIRFALAERYPDSYDSIKEIPVAEYEIIAETLKLAATKKQLPSFQDFQETGAIALGSQELPSETQEQIYNGVSNSLQDFIGNYHLSLSKLNDALAYISAKKIAKDFITIHSEVMRHDLETYLDDIASQSADAAKTLMAIDSKDFLQSKGVKLQGQKKPVSIAKTLETCKAILSLMD